MNRLAEIVLGDGMLCLCRFDDLEVPAFGTVCIVTIDGLSEFGEFVRIHEPFRSGNISYSGTFLHAAGEEELTRLAGNQEVLVRARGVLLKWVSDEKRNPYGSRMRFTARRERLYLTLDAADITNFKPVFNVLENRFQTQVSAQLVSSRALSGAIGGMGVCGRVLCCSKGVCQQSGVDMKMAKTQSIPLHDAAAVGLCGRLKCCIAYEI